MCLGYRVKPGIQDLAGRLTYTYGLVWDAFHTLVGPMLCDHCCKFRVGMAVLMELLAAKKRTLNPGILFLRSIFSPGISPVLSQAW